MDNNGKLEPYMKLGFKLLHSKDPNALNEMFKHFEAACRDRYGESRQPRNAAKDIPVPAALLADINPINLTADYDQPSTSSSSSSVPVGIESSAEEDEVIVVGPNDLVVDGDLNGSSSSSGCTRTQTVDDEVISISSDTEAEADADSDLELTSCCTVCRNANVSEGNGLVECLECRRAFHQNCFIPPLRNINIKDPRNVWYCNKCRPKKTEPNLPVKTLKKSTSKKSTGTVQISQKFSTFTSSSSKKPTSSKMAVLKKRAKMDEKPAKRRYVKKNKKNDV